MTETKKRKYKPESPELKLKKLQYKKEHMRSFAFRLHNESDAELIKIYDSIPDKAAFFRWALKKYAEENK